MQPLPLKLAACWVGGCLSPALRETIVTGIGVDSRKPLAGQLFVALKGENFDGHDYLVAALKQGAAAAVAERAPQGADPSLVITAPDSLKALGDLAQGLRRRAALEVTAITGSNGKTTTKEMLRTILAASRKVLANQGNFNNLVGLPLTLFELEADHQTAVLEMGMNRPGEIRRLMEIAEPRLGLVTNIGSAHLGGFKDQAELARAKGELYEGLPSTATALINLDDPLVVQEAARFKGRSITYGERPEALIRLAGWRPLGLDGQEFSVYGPGLEQGRRVRLNFLGRPNASNALAALSAAFELGIPWDEACESLAQARPAPGRLNIKNGLKPGWRIIDDSYNANPDSLSTGLGVLRRLPGAGKAAVLGDMLELGAAEGPAHEAAGRLAAQSGLDYLATVGPASQSLLQAARKAGFSPEKSRHFPGPEAAAEWLKEQLAPDSLILVKGSRALKLEKAVDLLSVRKEAG